MSNYKSETQLDLDPDFKSFFEDFYATSDTPDAHEHYVKYFTDDATLIMASTKVHGSDEILALRKSMWEKVESRSHNPIKIFPFGAYADQVMLHGTVKYGLKSGGEKEIDWAARAKLVKEEGKVKLAFYQVYLDTAAMAN
ncbi:hypothetical protein BDU57DRAFT_124640 [Ampelomyces quisqualis]|uniref:SnoaL-like domain-containing protein n=1 Tax=Ampelomyces quisqualis TaxID=50730 RepID=A0A6A5QWI1_AMPQU|nr:hypothetical protein BDU57DRAFT_124640 [Ampelomyces quisqualis]